MLLMHILDVARAATLRFSATVYQVCCGLQFKVNNYTASHGISMREDVYDALRTHGLQHLTALMLLWCLWIPLPASDS